MQGEESNKLDKVFMGFMALHNLSTHRSNSSSKMTRMISLIDMIGGFIHTDTQDKIKSCKELQGMMAEDGHYYDGLLVELLQEVVEMTAVIPENMTKACRKIVGQMLLLPLSEHSLLALLELSDVCSDGFDEPQAQHLHAYTLQALRSDTFGDFMTTDATACGRLLARCLNNSFHILQDDKEILKFADLACQTDLLRLVFS